MLKNVPPSIDGVVSTGPGGLHWTAVPGDALSFDREWHRSGRRCTQVPVAAPGRVEHPQFGRRADGLLPVSQRSGKLRVQGGRLRRQRRLRLRHGPRHGPDPRRPLRGHGQGNRRAGPRWCRRECQRSNYAHRRDRSVSVYVSQGHVTCSNIHKAGYGLASKIYDNAIVGGVWTLTRASVLSVDPTQSIDVANARQSSDCPGSLSEQARRQGKPPDGCGPGIRVQIPANSLVDSAGNPPSGPVQVALTTVDLAAPDGMPGDYSARDSSGDPFVMESAGAGTVEITGAAGRYNLAPGNSAQITIPVNPAQLGGAPPPTIPLLSYDEQQGLWVQEGTATLVGGTYVGKVSHFSEINTDQLKVNQACLRIDATSMPSSFQLELRIPTSSRRADDRDRDHSQRCSALPRRLQPPNQRERRAARLRHKRAQTPTLINLTIAAAVSRPFASPPSTLAAPRTRQLRTSPYSPTARARSPSN